MISAMKAVAKVHPVTTNLDSSVDLAVYPSGTMYKRVRGLPLETHTLSSEENS